MQHALYNLGIHDCYHMHTIRDNAAEDAPQWTRALDAKYEGKGEVFDKNDWDKLLGHCQAVSDIPASLFGPELAELYPDAKVIILNRDPEKWYASVLSSIHAPRPLSFKLGAIYCALFDTPSREWLKFVFRMSKVFGYDHGSEKDKALAWYKDIYDGFRERIPADRRLEYRMGDGWAPLCKHLDVPIPTMRNEAGEEVELPFPHLNDSDAFKEEMKQTQAVARERATTNVFSFVGKAAVTGATAYVGYLAWRTRLGGRV